MTHKGLRGVICGKQVVARQQSRITAHRALLWGTALERAWMSGAGERMAALVPCLTRGRARGTCAARSTKVAVVVVVYFSPRADQSLGVQGKTTRPTHGRHPGPSPSVSRCPYRTSYLWRPVAGGGHVSALIAPPLEDQSGAGHKGPSQAQTAQRARIGVRARRSCSAQRVTGH